MRALIKYPGGKSYLSKFIISHFPPGYEQMTYIEVFGGGASVLLNKEPSIKETYNDIDPNLYNLFYYLRYDPKYVIETIQKYTYSTNSFLSSIQWSSATMPCPHMAIREIILRRMSRGGLGKDFAWSERLRGGQPEGINSWENFQKDLPKIVNRLSNIEVLCKDFKDIIDEANPNILYYIDPPYMHSTRKSKKLYKYEMSEQDHEILATILNVCQGKVIISGYESDLYNQWYKNWRVSKKEIANHSGQNKKKNRRTEVLWMNY